MSTSEKIGTVLIWAMVTLVMACAAGAVGMIVVGVALRSIFRLQESISLQIGFSLFFLMTAIAAPLLMLDKKKRTRPEPVQDAS